MWFLPIEPIFGMALHPARRPSPGRLVKFPYRFPPSVARTNPSHPPGLAPTYCAGRFCIVPFQPWGALVSDALVSDMAPAGTRARLFGWHRHCVLPHRADAFLMSCMRAPPHWPRFWPRGGAKKSWHRSKATAPGRRYPNGGSVQWARSWRSTMRRYVQARKPELNARSLLSPNSNPGMPFSARHLSRLRNRK